MLTPVVSNLDDSAELLKHSIEAPSLLDLGVVIFRRVFVREIDLVDQNDDLRVDLVKKGVHLIHPLARCYWALKSPLTRRAPTIAGEPFQFVQDRVSQTVLVH